MSGAAQASAWQRTLTHAWTRRGLLALTLWPVALLFGALAALRRQCYQVGLFKARRVPARVIVVGNVVAGGSRGYGRSARDGREVLIESLISEVGDEPALIRHATLAPVFVAARRFEAAQSLLARYPDTQVIVCDDGLQHLGLQRDLEVCVFDDRGTGNGFLLPAGPLREPWPRAVDLVLHTGAHPAFEGFTAQRALADFAVRADGSRIALADLARSGARPLLALAAIAKPDDFFAMLRAQGLILERTLALPDHFGFEDWPGHEFAGYTLICTEKDAVKLWPQCPDALAVPLIFTPEPAFLARFDALLEHQLKPALSLPNGHTPP